MHLSHVGLQAALARFFLAFQDGDQGVEFFLTTAAVFQVQLDFGEHRRRVLPDLKHIDVLVDFRITFAARDVLFDGLEDHFHQIGKTVCFHNPECLILIPGGLEGSSRLYDALQGMTLTHKSFE